MIIIIVNIICEHYIKWLKGNPYHWSDLPETQDSEYFSEIMNADQGYYRKLKLERK